MDSKIKLSKIPEYLAPASSLGSFTEKKILCDSTSFTSSLEYWDEETIE